MSPRVVLVGPPGSGKTTVGELLATIDVGGRDMYLPAGSFFQTNLAMVPRVLGQIRAELRDTRPRT